MLQNQIKKTKISVLVLFLSCPAWADKISDRFTPLTTFSDDRQVHVLNQNFDRLNDFGVKISSCGIGAAVGISRTTVTLVTPEQDINYAVFVTPDWAANARVLQKSTTGFIIEYTPPTVQQRLDYILTR